MELGIGILLAGAAGLFASLIGLDRDRAFYPVMLIVIASYYCLFAMLGDSIHALGIEVIIFSMFTTGAVIGFKKSLWWIVAGLAAHGVMDVFHSNFVVNDGVQRWWPAFCGAFDVTAAVYLAILIKRRNRFGAS